MERHFEHELENLRSTLTQMGDLVDDQLGKSYQALFTPDLDTALYVIERDRDVDDFDSRIEAECHRLFALGQPVSLSTSGFWLRH